MAAQPGAEISYANPTVLAFYKELPFNLRETAEQHANAIRVRNAVQEFPALVPLLGKQTRVIDVGCGTGWLGCGIAHHYGSQVTGIDFNPVAIGRAREIAASLGVTAHFEVADLFLFEPEALMDVAISMGVLHHTDNCHAAIRRLCSSFIRPGGHVFIGLYHTYGRKPFLDHFQAMKDKGASEDEMFAAYAKLHSWNKDEIHLLSWFRDQVLHPHETQHTLEEMLPLLESEGMRLVSASLNRFQPFRLVEELLALERAMEETGKQRLNEGKYFPGFFAFLAHKED